MRRRVNSTAASSIALRAALGVAAAMMAPITNSLVFRLFDDNTLRMRAITVMIVVGMCGFVLAAGRWHRARHTSDGSGYWSSTPRSH